MAVENQNILISGAGIAGPTLAYWLRRHGFNPTVVEKAPKPREGGYLVDFRGTGVEVAEKMGVMPQVRQEQFVPKEMLFADESNEPIATIDLARLFRETFDDPSKAQTQIMRSKLARILYDKARDGVEYVFGDSIRAMRQDAQGVQVEFESGGSRRFDLVLGADGAHSAVRELTFGEKSRLTSYLGYYIAACLVTYPARGGTIMSHAKPGKFASLFCFPDNSALAYFIFKQTKKFAYERHDMEAQTRLFADAFAGFDWQPLPDILRQMEQSSDFYFDSADLLQLEHWSKGRVALVGDAGYPTPLTAWGVSLALIGAYVLAGELKNASGDHERAFEAYERELRPFVEKKTRGARGTGMKLVPSSPLGIWMRNQALKLFSVPPLSRLMARMTYGRMFREAFPLKDYG